MATQGLDHDANCAVHKPPRLVEVPREQNFDTRPSQYAQRGLRGRVAHVPSREVLRFSSYDINDDDDDDDDDRSFFHSYVKETSIIKYDDEADTVSDPTTPVYFIKG